MYFSLQMLFKFVLIMLFCLFELLQGIELQENIMFYTFVLIRAAKIIKICILSSPHNIRHKAHKTVAMVTCGHVLSSNRRK